MALLRLDKYISGAAGCSRQDARDKISAGRVCVNGVVVKKIGEKIPDDANVTLDKIPLKYEEHIYLILNKPLGYVCSTDDPSSPTVLTLVSQELMRDGLFPAGRLDKYSQGMVIITDDGVFAHNILSPRRHLPKKYYVELDAPLMNDEMKELFLKGVYLGNDEYSSPAYLEPITETSGYVTIHEGIYHQVRRMFDQNGAHVTALKRVQIGCLPLPLDLEEGHCRALSADELTLLTAKEQTEV